MVHRLRHLPKVLLIALLASACGDSDSSSSAPSPSPTPPPSGGGGSTTTTTITLTSAGASPRDITVSVGSRVTFTNNDSVPHDMASDPHPAHTDCPEVTVGFIAASQSAQTQNLNRARVCTYHEHNHPTNGNLPGTDRIQ